MLKKVEEDCENCLRISGEFSWSLLHIEHGTSKNADCICMRMAVGWTEKIALEEKKVL